MTPEADRMLNPERPAESLEEKAARLEAEIRASHGTPSHTCPPGHLYACPTSLEVESSCHGGFDVCCDRPDLHVPLPDGPATDALSNALSDAVKERFAAQVIADDAWGTVWLHGNWPWLTKCMTTPEREYAADCVARWSARLAEIDGDLERGEPDGLRWWRDAS